MDAGQLEYIKDKLTSIFMRANRAIYAQPLPLNTKNKWICRKIKVKSTRQLILEAGVKVIQRIVNTGQPRQIFSQLIFPRNMCNTARIRLANVPRTKKCKGSTIYQMIWLFTWINSIESVCIFHSPPTMECAKYNF